MSNVAFKQKEILTVDNIHKADEFKNSEAVLDKAFEIYNEVVDSLPTLPIKLLPRLRDSFNKENTLIALDEEGQVVGVALTEKLENPEEAIGRFGKKALKYCNKVFGTNDEPIYELEAIAVKPSERRRGLGHAFYEAAKKHTNDRCVAVVTVENNNGNKTAISGGFTKIPGALFNAPFAVEGDAAKLTTKDKATHIVKASLYSSKKKKSIFDDIDPATFAAHGYYPF